MENKNANNFWTVSPIITKFGMHSLRQTPKSRLCSKIKKSWKSKMAADAIFLVPQDRALVKPVGRFWRVIRQNACFGTRRCLLGFRKINISVFTPKIAKNPNFGGTFNVFPMENSSGSGPGQSCGPNWVSDRSKRVCWPKEVPFGV